MPSEGLCYTKYLLINESDKTDVASAMFAAAFAQKATAGSFVLYYEGHPTATISHAASAAMVQAALSAIPAIQGVNVDFSVPSSGACNSAEINVIQVGRALSPGLFCDRMQ